MSVKRKAPLAFPMRLPFAESLGIELHVFEEGRAELRMDLEANHLNTWDVAHGGVVMTLLDVSMAMATRSTHPNAAQGGGGVATIEMKTSFMRPAQGRLRAAGRVIHKTATLAFCEATLFDGHDAPCATASATFKFLRTRGTDTTAAATATPSPDPILHPA